MLKLADGTEMTGLWDNGNQLQIEYNMDLHEPDEESKTNAETEAETQNSENGEESKAQENSAPPAQEEGAPVAA